MTQLANRRLAAGVVAATLVAVLGCGRGGPKRLPEAGFQVAFGPHSVASEMASGKTVAADITVKNASPVTWPSKPDSKNRYNVNLSYHWLDKKGKMVVFDGLRTPLPRDLKPGESVDLKTAIQAPEKPGRYTLELTMVQEQSAWFPEKDGAKLVLPVTVIEGGESNAEAGDAAAVDAAAGATTREKGAQHAEKPGTPREETKVAAKPSLETSGVAGTAAKVEKPVRSVNEGSGSWSVQVASYADRKIADGLAKKLTTKGYDAYVTSVKIKRKEWHRVRVGHLKSRGEAESLRDTLRSTEKLERSIVAAR